MIGAKMTYFHITEDELDTLLSSYMEEMHDIIQGGSTKDPERRKQLHDAANRYNAVYDEWAALQR